MISTMPTPIEVLRSYTRNDAFPIDATTLFENYAAAIDYVHNDPSAYIGQIISINDSSIHKSVVYKVDYDENDATFKTKTLSEISVGNGTAAFSFKGSKQSLDVLESFGTDQKIYIKNGDMYYVTDENKMYVAVKTTDGNVAWSPVSMEIMTPYASRNTSDGIIHHELYNTFFDDSSNASVYYSPKGNKKDANGNPANTWLKINASEDEQSSGTISSLISTGKVREMLGLIHENIAPYITITCDLPINCTSNETIQPTFEVLYHKSLAGDITAVTITLIKNDNADQYQVLDSFKPSVTKKSDGVYSFSWKDAAGKTADANDVLEYTVMVEYDSETGQSAYCSEKIKFYFYDIIKYGITGKGYQSPVYTCPGKDDTVISLVVDPSILSDTQTMNTIWIEVPSSCYLDQVIFAPQQDYYAKDIFTETSISNGSRFTYTVVNNSDDDFGFGCKSEFKFRLIQL